MHSQYFGFVLHQILRVLEVSRGSVLRVPLVLSLCSVYLEYEVYFDRLCAASTTLKTIVRYKSPIDGPTRSFSKIFSLVTIRVLRALEVFREYVLRGVCAPRTLNISRLSGFRTVHNIHTLSSWTFLVLGIYLWASSIHAICWSPVLQYSQYLDYELFSGIFYYFC